MSDSRRAAHVRNSRRRRQIWGLLLAALLVVAALAAWRGKEATASAESGRVVAAETTVAVAAPERWRVEVLESLPHDEALYTQGLEFHNGLLYESAGRYGQSRLLRYTPGSQTFETERRLSTEMFAEGLTRIGDRLVQLTWREHTAIVWSLSELEEIERWDYRGEGWGLCHDGRRLVMSDGSSRLTIRDSGTFAEIARIEVRASGQPVDGLNELECAEGWIYANVYETDTIVRIDPVNGRVAAIIDAGGLLDGSERHRAEVLNGIAYDSSSETFFLTGKLWPKIFRVRFLPI